jgi:hypothetical protein
LGVEATTDVEHLMGKPISDSADDWCWHTSDGGGEE